MTKEEQLENIKELFRRFKDGRFDVESVLGIGGMGVVVRARDTTLQVARAIKIFNPELNDEVGLLERFKKEAAIMSKIDHSNIVRVYDRDIIEDHHFIILEWVDGGSLGGYLKQYGAMHPTLALQMIYRVCDALSVAHKQSVVHRDIKPDNILISTEGVPKVTDFGIAHMDDPEKKRLTLTNQGAGSPGYMAPEQMSELSSTDARADIYGVGVTFWSLLTALRPPGALFFHDIEDSPELLQNVPACLHDILKKAVARRSEHRYQSIEELVLALRSVEHLILGSDLKPSAIMIDQDANTTDPTMIGVTKFSRKTPMYANDASLSTGTLAYRPSGEVAKAPAVELVVDKTASKNAPKSYRSFLIASIVLCVVGLGGFAVVYLSQHKTPKPSSTQEQNVAAVIVPDIMIEQLDTSVSVDVPIAKDVSPVEVETKTEPDVVAEIGEQEGEKERRREEGVTFEKKERKVSKLVRPIEVKAGEKLVLEPQRKITPPPSIVDPPQPKPEMVKVQVGFEPQGGDTVKVWLVGSGGKHKLPGSVQPGIYKVVAIFQDQDEERTVMKNLEIKEGVSIRLACWSATEKCSKL